MEKRKADLQPSTSLDSAQTAQTASPSAHVGSSNPHRVDPNAAKLAIKEALAPLGPSQLARVQEQLRQSRLARQQQPLAGFEVSGSASAQPCCPCQHPSTACQPQLQDPSMGSSEVACTPLVQQVAAALAKGQLSAHDIMRVLNTLDPSVLRTPPQQQQQHQLRMPQHHLHHQDALRAQQQHQRTGMLSAPTAIPVPPMAFGSSLLPPAVASVPRQRLRTPAASVAAPYSAVLNNLQLPPAALAAHAAAATAAAAVAKAGHPGSSISKGKRSSRKARFQLSRLVGSVSTASDAAGHMSLDDHAADVQDAALDMAAFLPQEPTPTGDPLFVLAAHAGDSVMQDSWEHHANPCPAHFTPADCATADAAVPPAGAQGAGCTSGDVEGAAPTSLQARFARLPAAVQEDILRQLDELTAWEDELRGGSGSGSAREPEHQGPRRSSRARKVRNWEDGGFTARGSNRSSSPTPPPTASSDEQQQELQPYSRAAPAKRIRLDASSNAHSSPAPHSPEGAASCSRQGCGAASPDIEMLPALDPLLYPEAVVEPEQPVRKRRIPRKAGLRAAARKRMHRATFRRGNPQRAPVC